MVGRPDPEWGEALIAFVVAGSAAPPDEAEIIAKCRSLLAPYKVPKYVKYLDKLPRNAAGKLMKRELRDTLV